MQRVMISQRRTDCIGRHGITARLLLLCGACLAGLFISDETSAQESSPRFTRTVELIRGIEPGVAAVFAIAPDGSIGSGSGSVIHEAGFILTNDHVVRGLQGFVLLDRLPPLRYQTVGRLPEKDLAIIRVRTDQPLKAIPLGRSHDLMNGEPILLGGNPGGRGIVFSSGIISSRAVMSDAPNALVMANRFREDKRDRMIQFDAASNSGNSGGPLINAEGRQIGVVAAKNFREENTNYAIPIDRLRSSLSTLLAPEVRGDFWTGLELNPLSEQALISVVAADSPAEKAGVKVGDVITTVNGKTIRDPLGWLFALHGLTAGDPIDLTLTRDGTSRSAVFQTISYPQQPTVAATGKADGLRYAIYEGQFSTCPEFAKLKPVASGQSQSVQGDKLDGLREDDYAILYTGYVQIPKSGAYRIVLGSDDGSRLFLQDQLAIDNDSPHPYQEGSCLRRLSEGLHPIRIEFFEGTGDARLTLKFEADNGTPTPALAPVKFFHNAENK